MHNKLTVAVIYGGQSPEHDISLISANNIIKGFDPEKYTVFPVGIHSNGHWYYQPNAITDKELILRPQPEYEVILQPDKTFCFLNDHNNTQTVHVVFPVLHGPNGEDGTIQGFLQLMGIPFVGCDALSSALTMDKDMTKRLLKAANLPTANHITLYQQTYNDKNLEAMVKKIGFPCFVKPANMGSSVGITKVKNASALPAAINDAFLYDNKIIVEEFIPGREIECAILGNQQVEASLPSEIKISSSYEFYSYDAKYDDHSGTAFDVPAKLSPELVSKVQDLAKKAFLALECKGMARVDFFLTENNEFYINELNSIPGFTHVSMYPRMWETSGLPLPKLLDKLIALAFERYDSSHSIKRIKA